MSPDSPTPAPGTTRRDVLRGGARGLAILSLGAVAGLLMERTRAASQPRRDYWQIDPDKCVGCDKCATHCVLEDSAVKCVHAIADCGHCRICSGYFPADAAQFNTGAENQMCPTAAILRAVDENAPGDGYVYHIDADLCIGCGRCVQGCTQFGNGSLFLQVMHNRCLNCNDCSIARACPHDAFVRIHADPPYLTKHVEKKNVEV